MRTRILLAVTLVLALAVAPAATAQKKRTRDLDATVHMAVIGPNGENGSRFAGELTGRPLGTAALLFRNTITGSASTGKVVLYTKHGTIRANAANELQPQPDGSVLVPGTFRITGGTGRYRGATGSGTFEGGLPADSNIFELQAKGRIRY